MGLPGAFILSRHSERISMAGTCHVLTALTFLSHISFRCSRGSASLRPGMAGVVCTSTPNVLSHTSSPGAQEMSLCAITIWQMQCRCQAGQRCSCSPAAATAMGPGEQAQQTLQSSLCWNVPCAGHVRHVCCYPETPLGSAAAACWEQPGSRRCCLCSRRRLGHRSGLCPRARPQCWPAH